MRLTAETPPAADVPAPHRFTRSPLVEIAKASIVGTFVDPRDIAHTANDWATLVNLA